MKLSEVLSKYKDTELSKEVLCQIKKDVSDYVSRLYEKTSFDFNNYKFDVVVTPSKGTVSINPANLSTALLLHKGIAIDPSLTEYEDEEAYYTFDNGLKVKPKKVIDQVVLMEIEK